jgi:glutaredoxin
MEQRCTIVTLYLNWALFLAGALFAAGTGRYLLLAVWLLAAPLAQMAYVRAFPRLSQALGYGSVDDQPAVSPAAAPVAVTLYTAAGCPFCPIVEGRLEALRATMGFHLSKVDVTMRPDVLAAKHIKAIPVIQVGDGFVVGNATSRELAALIAGAGAHR